MRNTSSASDSRRTRSGKDASVYNENGVMVAYIETFKSTVNFANSKYKVLGDMQEHSTPGSYTVTLSFSAITIMSEEFFTDVMAAMEIGESPRWNIQGALGGRDGNEERVMYRDVLPDGDIDIQNYTVGDTIKRQFNCFVNKPPKLASLLAAKAA